MTSVLEATEAFDPQYWNWGVANAAPRFLHAMIRVRDLERSLRFYTEGFGMKILDRFDVPVRRVSAAYIGFGSYDEGGLLELTHKWDSPDVTLGSFHVAIGVPQMEEALDRLLLAGAEVEMKPTILVPGGPKVAFVKDPDGYSVELIQTRRS